MVIRAQGNGLQYIFCVRTVQKIVLFSRSQHRILHVPKIKRGCLVEDETPRISPVLNVDEKTRIGRDRETVEGLEVTRGRESAGEERLPRGGRREEIILGIRGR